MDPNTPKEKEDETKTNVKKQQTRDEEATLADGYLYFLIRVFGYTAKWKQPKNYERTIKLYCADELSIENILTVTQNDILVEGRKLQETFGSEPINIEMNQKQQKRSKEAEVSNGYLQMLINA